MDLEKEKPTINQCDECDSDYYLHTSPMKAFARNVLTFYTVMKIVFISSKMADV